MPNANQNLKLKVAMSQTLPSTMLTIFLVCLSMGGLNQPAYAAGAIQPPSCEHPPAPKPQVPYPPNLTQVPINAPSFPPPDTGSAPTTPGEPIQPPSCVKPPVPSLPVPYPPGLKQVPVNAPPFPCPPVQPYCPINYGFIPFCPNPTFVVPGAGNFPGIGIPGDAQYGYGTSTLRNPLVPGANWTGAEYPAAIGDPPPPGSGLTPNPVTPGMLGEQPTPVPWTDGTAGNPESHMTNQAVIPANQIDQQNNTVSMPYTNFTAQPPGSWQTNVPYAPSTPGEDPGILRQPAFSNGSGQNYSPAAALVPLGSDGQLTGTAPTTRSMQRGQTNDFGLSQKTSPQKQYFAYRMQMSSGSNGQSVFDRWQGMPGSTTQDFGVGVKGIQGKNGPAQISYDATRPADYPGGQTETGNLSSNSQGNHYHNADPKGFANAQVTNDLYGTPMINPNRNYGDGNGNSVSSVPLTTIAPY